MTKAINRPTKKFLEEVKLTTLSVCQTSQPCVTPADRSRALTRLHGVLDTELMRRESGHQSPLLREVLVAIAVLITVTNHALNLD